MYQPARPTGNMQQDSSNTISAPTGGRQGDEELFTYTKQQLDELLRTQAETTRAELEVTANQQALNELEEMCEKLEATQAELDDIRAERTQTLCLLADTEFHVHFLRRTLQYFHAQDTLQSGAYTDEDLFEDLEPRDDTYCSVGPRVLTTDFCHEFPQYIAVPNDTTCGSCLEPLDIVDTGDQQAVRAICGHDFHMGCLDRWVNDAAMPQSNHCPVCQHLLFPALALVPL